MDTRDFNRATRLTTCLVDRYMAATGLKFHANSITTDMTEYHSFSEIDPNTIAAIIETGFLNLDRTYLTTHTDQVADGIVQGILCFVNNENIEPTPFPPMSAISASRRGLIYGLFLLGLVFLVLLIAAVSAASPAVASILQNAGRPTATPMPSTCRRTLPNPPIRPYRRSPPRRCPPRRPG